jgi:hypothetical protein
LNPGAPSCQPAVSHQLDWRGPYQPHPRRDPNPSPRTGEIPPCAPGPRPPERTAAHSLGRVDIVIDQTRLRRLLTKIEANHHAKGWDKPPSTYLIYDAALDRETDLRYRSTFGLMYGIATNVEDYAAQPFLPNLHGHPAHHVFKMAKNLEAAQSLFDNSPLASASRAFVDLAHSPALFALAMCMEAWSVTETRAEATARLATGRRTIADHPNAQEIRDLMCVDLTGQATHLIRPRGKPMRIESGPLFYGRTPDGLDAQTDASTESRREGGISKVGGIVAQSLGAILAALARRPVPKLNGVPLDSPGA